MRLSREASVTKCAMPGHSREFIRTQSLDFWVEPSETIVLMRLIASYTKTGVLLV